MDQRGQTGPQCPTTETLTGGDSGLHKPAGLEPADPAPMRGPTGWGLAVLRPTCAWWRWADSGRGSRMSRRPQDAGPVLRGDGCFGQRAGLCRVLLKAPALEPV